MDGEDSVLKDIQTIKQDLINQTISEAPEDKPLYRDATNEDTKKIFNTSYGFNQANQQWRELLNKLK